MWRAVLVAYICYAVFAVYCVIAIPDEITDACKNREEKDHPCEYRKHQTEIVAVCAVMVTLSFPLLFLLVLGPVVNVAVGVGGIRGRIAMVINQCDDSDLPAAFRTDRWMLWVSSLYHTVQTVGRECLTTMFRPLESLKNWCCRGCGGCGVFHLVFFIVWGLLMCVAWPTGLCMIPLLVLWYLSALISNVERMSNCQKWSFYGLAVIVGITWYIFYFVVIYKKLCPKRWDNAPCGIG